MKKDRVMRQSSSAKRTTGSSLVEVSSFQHAAVSRRVVSTPQSLQSGAGRERLENFSVFAILKQREVASELGAERNAVSWTMVAKQMYICSMNCVPVSLSLTYERAEDHAWEP